MSHPIADIVGDTIEVAAYGPGFIAPTENGHIVSVEIHDREADRAAVHLTVDAARELIARLKLAVKGAAAPSEPEHECPVCSESVANEGDTCSLHDDFIGCGQCGTLRPSEDIFTSDRDGTFCPSCLHNARRSGWDG